MAIPYLNLDAVDRTRVLGQYFLFWEALVLAGWSWASPCNSMLLHAHQRLIRAGLGLGAAAFTWHMQGPGFSLQHRAPTKE